MKKLLLEEVKTEIARLQKRIKELEAEDIKRIERRVNVRDYFYDYKFTGAVRRASLDLTRALARMRGAA